jgi:hypothetical protein
MAPLDITKTEYSEKGYFCQEIVRGDGLAAFVPPHTMRQLPSRFKAIIGSSVLR